MTFPPHPHCVIQLVLDFRLLLNAICCCRRRTLGSNWLQTKFNKTNLVAQTSLIVKEEGKMRKTHFNAYSNGNK